MGKNGFSDEDLEMVKTKIESEILNRKDVSIFKGNFNFIMGMVIKRKI